MKKKILLGLLLITILCVLGIFRTPILTYFNGMYTIWKDQSTYPVLQAKIVPLGKVNENAIEFSPDGSSILIGEQMTDEAGNIFLFSNFKLVNAQGEFIANLGPAKWGYFIPDGILLVAPYRQDIDANMTMLTTPWKFFYYAQDGTFIKETAGAMGVYPQLIFNHDQSKFVTFHGYEGGQTAEVERIYSIDGTELASFSLMCNEEINQIQFSADGKKLSMTSYFGVYQFDTAGNLLQEVVVPQINIPIPRIFDSLGNSATEDGILFSPDLSQFVISDEFDQAEIYTMEGNLIKSLESVVAITYTPDGRYLIGRKFGSHYSDEIYVYDTENDFSARLITVYDDLYELEVDSTTGRLLIYGCTDQITWESGTFCYGGNASLWNMDGTLIEEMNDLHEVYNAIIVPNSELVFTSGCVAIHELSRIFPTFNCMRESGRMHNLKDQTVYSLDGTFSEIIASPDGNGIVTINHDGEAELLFLEKNSLQE